MREKNKNIGKTFQRLMAYILKTYKFHLIFVAVCIFVSVLANVKVKFEGGGMTEEDH